MPPMPIQWIFCIAENHCITKKYFGSGPERNPVPDPIELRREDDGRSRPARLEGKAGNADPTNRRVGVYGTRETRTALVAVQGELQLAPHQLVRLQRALELHRPSARHLDRRAPKALDELDRRCGKRGSFRASVLAS